MRLAVTQTHYSSMRLSQALHPFLVTCAAALLLLFTACGTADVDEDTQPDTPNTEPLDPNERPVESVEIRPAKFADRADDLLKTLFVDYREEKMQAVDQTPKFKEANRSIYRKFRRSQPIEVALSKNAYPRLTVKAFRFAEQEKAEEVSLRWLSGHETSGDSLVLGGPIDALKSPPHFCALVRNEFYLVQTSCIYQHESYDEMRERFEAWAKRSEATHAWEITCEAGKVRWVDL